METLIVLFILGVIGVALMNSGKSDSPPVVVAEAPAAGLRFSHSISVSADTPQALSREINRVKKDNTNNLFSRNYVIGTPQIAADGRSAIIPLYDE